MALAQGGTAGANMTGRKRQRFEAVPLASAVALGMQFVLVGDFSLPHLMGEIEGSREKGNFIVRYRRGEHIMAAGFLTLRPVKGCQKWEGTRASTHSIQKQ